MAGCELSLVSASAAGDVGAFAQLVEKYQLLATSVALAASGVPAIAEELAQEAFVTAWYRLPELRELGKFRSWLCGIVRNHARTARRGAAGPARSRPARPTRRSSAAS
jgi:DNA-directed RNA polymerase specialized sigma24 family protein